MTIRHKFTHHKYRAVQTIVDGFKFPSKKQANYYRQLKAAQESGDLLFFLREAPFHFPGGGRYVVDFVEYWANGDVRFVDVKGFKTESYKFKKRMVEATYPIKIMEA